MRTPDSILENSENFYGHSWEEYEPSELGMWVHLLLKRSKHRSNLDKAAKDLKDAQNYLNMLQEHINYEKERRGLD